jgi:hypothetical protein
MRNFIDIVESTREQNTTGWPPADVVAYAIKEILAANPGKTPHQINRGQCDELADLLERLDKRFESLELGNFHKYKDDEPIGFDQKLLRNHWPNIKPWPGMTWADMFDPEKGDLNWTGTHVWAYCSENDLHYDIETPGGVRNPFDLKFFDTWSTKLS